MTFRDRLIATLWQLRPVLEQPGVLVVGSEVPNLLQPAAASTLVVSQDVDIAVPVDGVEAVKRRLRELDQLVPSTDEPSVFVPKSPTLIEANFLGLDSRIREASETYVFEDSELPLMVFGPLGLLRPGPVVNIEGLRVPLPRVADLMVEKLVTERTGEKGVRDLLVVAGLIANATSADIDEMITRTASLSAELRYAVRSGLTMLSLMDGRTAMPDPMPVRHVVKRVLERLEAQDG